MVVRNDLLMPILVALRVNVPVTATSFLTPPVAVILPTGIVLDQLLGVPLVTTSNRNRQLPLAAMVAPVRLAVV